MQHANIWSKVLSQDEKVLYEFSVSGRWVKTNLVIWSIILAPLALVGLFGRNGGAFFWAIVLYGVVWFYFGFYIKAAHAYAFTDKRVLVHVGWLSTKMISIDYGKITDLFVAEKFLDRLIFKTGKIVINTAGTSGHEAVLINVAEPYEIKKKLEAIKEGKKI